jgi:hypothetical protein
MTDPSAARIIIGTRYLVEDVELVHAHMAMDREATLDGLRRMPATWEAHRTCCALGAPR